MTATTFWVLNSLNKSYIARISYPIQFVYDQRQLVPVKPLPEEVMVSVTGKGWKLLRKNLMFQVKPAELSIRGLPYVKRLPGAALRPAIANALDGLELNYVATDTLYFDFDHLITRKIPLGIDTAQVRIGPGFTYGGQLRIQPDSVAFTGPKQIISMFPSPYPLAPPEAALQSSFKGELPLLYDFTELVKANISKAQVQFAVLPLDKLEVVVQPVLKNFPPKYRLAYLNGPVKVKYAFHPRNRGLIEAAQFEVTLDYAQYNAADSSIVPTITQKPTGIRQASIAPGKVKISLTAL
ncbi:hypothetical protein GU926_12930 [Nibribacter ruber]|uniref:YbbR-like domain-containing protein n=1 Tax=Nibribacter ruber TaxID=2698458 RepID=A0A6P1NX81_9BACT|nr:hypothetical protein [Nibribacter ruber]QHL88287.1 hypothetical protein GU926_12930 [Nibribacter ruber]